jgi:hypothetical protein
MEMVVSQVITAPVKALGLPQELLDECEERARAEQAKMGDDGWACVVNTIATPNGKVQVSCLFAREDLPQVGLRAGDVMYCLGNAETERLYERLLGAKWRARRPRDN